MDKEQFIEDLRQILYSTSKKEATAEGIKTSWNFQEQAEQVYEFIKLNHLLAGPQPTNPDLEAKIKVLSQALEKIMLVSNEVGDQKSYSYCTAFNALQSIK